MIDAALASAGDALPGTDWLAAGLGFLSALVGSGGVVAIYKARHDRKAGVAQQELDEGEAISAHWRSIIETQTKSLLEPMQKRLGEVEDEVKVVKVELAKSRQKYWSAISHIRTLYTWISRHLPPEVEATQIPEPPAALVEDI